MYIIITSIVISMIIIFTIVLYVRITGKNIFKKCNYLLDSVILIFSIAMILLICNILLSVQGNKFVIKQQSESYKLIQLNVVNTSNIKQYVQITNNHTVKFSYLNKKGEQVKINIPLRNTSVIENNNCVFIINKPVFNNIIERILLGKPFLEDNVKENFPYYEIYVPKESIMFQNYIRY